eukprot:12858_1
MMSLLILSTLFFHQALSDPDSCNFFYDSLGQAPIPLDVCYWRGPSKSYGFYCTESWNGTTYDQTMVVHLQFDDADCPDGLEGGNGYFYEEDLIYNCDDLGDFCHCDGNPSLCTIATSTNCNESYPIEEDYVFDVCISDTLEHTQWGCDENKGVWGMGYEDEGCSGDKLTPAPTPSPLGISGDPFCWQTDCGYPDAGKEGADTGIIILVVILCICGCLCCVVGIWYVMKKRKKDDQYFDNNNTDNTAF